MKTITIRLSDVEAAMLVELQKQDNSFRSIEGSLSQYICKAYSDCAR